MKHHTETEENYLKCILRFSEQAAPVSTSTIAASMGTTAASVTDMLKKLSDKQLVLYQPYKGVSLTEQGRLVALRIVRKHRLWEVFLVEKLKFSWDNVHEVAEQLEHVDSPELIRRIDEFLGYPKFDPHGDPIPTEEGEMARRDTRLLSDIQPGDRVVIAGVQRSDQDFLQYLDLIGLTLNRVVTVVERIAYDESLRLMAEGGSLVVSGSVARNISVLRMEPVA
jgi:DtxR family Mn-dependent transcriptional regulator